MAFGDVSTEWSKVDGLSIKGIAGGEGSCGFSSTGDVYTFAVDAGLKSHGTQSDLTDGVCFSPSLRRGRSQAGKGRWMGSCEESQRGMSAGSTEEVGPFSSSVSLSFPFVPFLVFVVLPSRVP